MDRGRTKRTFTIRHFSAGSGKRGPHMHPLANFSRSEHKLRSLRFLPYRTRAAQCHCRHPGRATLVSLSGSVSRRKGIRQSDSRRVVRCISYRIGLRMDHNGSRLCTFSGTHLAPTSIAEHQAALFQLILGTIPDRTSRPKPATSTVRASIRCCSSCGGCPSP